MNKSRTRTVLLVYVAIVAVAMLAGGVVIAEENLDIAGVSDPAIQEKITGLPLWMAPVLGGGGIVLGLMVDRLFRRKRATRKSPERTKVG